MSDNVVTFEATSKEGKKAPEEFILVCSRCENTTFKLYAGGKVECAYCEGDVSTADPEDHRKWRETMGEKKEGDEVQADRNSELTTTQKHRESPTYALRFVMKRVDGWADAGNMAMMISYNLQGEGQHWFDIATEEQREWVMEKFDALKETLKTMELGQALEQKIRPTNLSVQEE